ncbi:hypothetical protein HU200_009805 [Digitaria exilis]|uniref:Phosphoglycerate mutase n=1 Tax=Digitaria exilis TaxID=1010633 RepID=A0A835FIX7_9POAL|nr:hypothetical protein HU200_009805 [Digitaria exilis]
MAAPAIPESPHGEHVTVMVFVRHGETEWNASGTVQRLTERDMGMFQGMNKHDATKTDAYKAYSSNNDRNEHLPGGGESLISFPSAVSSCLNEIADKHMGSTPVLMISCALCIQSV